MARQEPRRSTALHGGFGIVGIVLVFVGFKIFDKAITKIDLEAEVAKGNVAAAVLSAAVIIALAIIIAAAMS